MTLNYSMLWNQFVNCVLSVSIIVVGWSALGRATSLHFAAIHATTFASARSAIRHTESDVEAAQGLPLLGRERLTDGERHQRILFFQLGAGSSDLVDLRNDLLLIGVIGFDERLERGFLAFHFCSDVNQF